MAKETKIQWCDRTFNPWEGCSHKSPGCDNCYAENRANRWKSVEWGDGNPRRRTSKSNWRQPILWSKQAEKTGDRPKVFCASLADWLDDQVPIEWLADLLDLIFATPHLDWLVLSKRPENWRSRLQSAAILRPTLQTSKWLDNEPPSNVVIGTTIEDQKRAIERLPLILGIPAKRRFLSVEPMLEAIDIQSLMPKYQADEGTCGYVEGLFHQVICGGESGGKSAREFDLNWARSLHSQCQALGVPFFMKQLGSNPVENGDRFVCSGSGGIMHEFPGDLQVREEMLKLEEAIA